MSAEENELREQIHGFITKEIKTEPHENNDDLCTRFVRKKFKCILIFFFTIISISELLTTIFAKTDLSVLQNLYQKIINLNISSLPNFTKSH